MIGMETYNGHVRTPQDAIILFEACRIGLLPRVQRRLSDKERTSIQSGSVFVWDEREAGMRRWTDGKSWSASRVSGSFLTYREMEGKRGTASFDKNSNRDGTTGAPEADSDGGGPDGYRYKPDGLMKQSFSITTNQGQHLHLISYYSRSSTAPPLMQPTNDIQLRHIRPEKGMYPDAAGQEQSNIPAVTRGPMGSPGYAHAPNPPQAYNRGAPGPYYGHHSWAPPSPLNTPPPHYGYSPSPYYQHGPGHPMHQMHYPPPPNAYGHYPQGTPFDRPPPPMSNPGMPPYQTHHQHAPVYPGSYPPPPPTYHVSSADPRMSLHNRLSASQSSYATYQPPPLQAPPYAAAQVAERQAPAAALATPTVTSEAATQADNSPNESENKQAQQSTLKESTDTSQTAAGAPAPPPVPAPALPASGQTIPSISAMLNAGEGGNPPPRTSSRSPGGTARAALQDIPSHKLGFEVSRDVQALRTLDKTTFKQY